MNRHAFYNDLNVGFSFRNMTIDGNLRGSGRFDGTLRSLPRTREYINVNKARGFDQVMNAPLLARRNELENHAHDRVFIIRNTITSMSESRENILLDNVTVVGQSRMRNPRIVNGIRLGDAAYFPFRQSQQIHLEDGFEVDLSGVIIGCMNVSVHGHGKVICNNLVALEDPDNPGQFGALTIQPGAEGSLEVIGSGGRSGVVLADRDNPDITRQRVRLTDWTFLPGLRNRTGLVVRWDQEDPAFAANVTLEGKQHSP